MSGLNIEAIRALHFTHISLPENREAGHTGDKEAG